MVAALTSATNSHFEVSHEHIPGSSFLELPLEENRAQRKENHHPFTSWLRRGQKLDRVRGGWCWLRQAKAIREEGVQMNAKGIKGERMNK